MVILPPCSFETKLEAWSHLHLAKWSDLDVKMLADSEPHVDQPT